VQPPPLRQIKSPRGAGASQHRIHSSGRPVNLALHSGPLALFGIGPTERTLQVLDLQRLAGSLLKRQPARRAAAKAGAGHA
jgi:hypothetical protein